MKFNSVSDKNGLIQMCERTTGLGLAAISGDAGNLAWFTNLINVWLKNVAFWIWECDKDWHFDDSNHTDFSIATTTLVNDQNDYPFPSELLRLRKVEIMKNDGDYYELKLIKTKDSRLRNKLFQEDAGLPTHYYKEGNSLIVYPKVDSSLVTTSKGLRLIFDREVNAFTTSDTTQEPGFASQFHPILYYGASMEWAILKGKKETAGLCNKMLFGSDAIRDIGLIEMLKRHYSKRDDNEKNIIAPNFINNNFE